MPRYIDSDEVKKAIEESWDGCLGAYDSHEITMNDLWVIDKVPTADVVERKRGKWIKVGNRGRSYKCNQCGNYLDFDGVNAGRGDANYCPNCGAIMDERREDGEIH